MKFVRLNLFQDNYGVMSSTPYKIKGEVEMEVAGINFRVTLKPEVIDAILRVIQPDVDEGVKKLQQEIGHG